jgi:hypothetical protein
MYKSRRKIHITIGVLPPPCGSKWSCHLYIIRVKYLIPNDHIVPISTPPRTCVRPTVFWEDDNLLPRLRLPIAEIDIG